jgi:hypothetical protein
MARDCIPTKQNMETETYPVATATQNITDLPPEDIYFEIDEMCNRLSFIKNIQKKEVIMGRLQEYKDYCIFLQKKKIVSIEIVEHIIHLYEDIFTAYITLWEYFDAKKKELNSGLSIETYHKYYDHLVQKIEILHDYLIFITQQEQYKKFVICLTILS